MFFARTLFRVAAPLREVSWADFILADVLTSLSKALSDLERAACHLLAGPVMRAHAADQARAPSGPAARARGRWPCFLIQRGRGLKNPATPQPPANALTGAPWVRSGRERAARWRRASGRARLRRCGAPKRHWRRPQSSWSFRPNDRHS